KQVRTDEHATNITRSEFFLSGSFCHINHFAHLLVQFVIEIVVTSSLRRGTRDTVVFRAELDIKNRHHRTNHTQRNQVEVGERSGNERSEEHTSELQSRENL